MKKRRKASPRKSRGPVRYGLEAAVLCVLLMTAAYVGSVNRPAPSVSTPQKQTETVKEKAPAPSAQKKTTSATGQGSTAGKSSTADKERAAAVSAQNYRLVRVSDGDSFELRDEKNKSVKVRLYGVDAPESKQRFGKESREHLRELLEGKTLRLKTLYKDNYKRSVAIVYLCSNNVIDERSVNQRQVQAGMAWVYDYFCTSDICKTWKVEEAMARKQNLGLWKDKKPTPPWQWRRSQSRR